MPKQYLVSYKFDAVIQYLFVIANNEQHAVELVRKNIPNILPGSILAKFVSNI